MRDRALGSTPVGGEGRAHRLLHGRALWLALLGVVLVAGLALLLHELAGGDGFSLADGSLGDWTYLAVVLLVAGDAICALLPGETTLNAASTLAAEGSLELGLVVLAGLLGAIVGDSALYWIARAESRRLRPRLENATRNDKVAYALDFMGQSAPVLLVVGRYVPGLRFVVNATMGLSAYPYRRFLVWSAVGGAAWSVYTCLLAYAVGTALADFPLASVVISGAITTLAIAAVFLVARRRWPRRGEAATGST
jgi:membrane-associated protein